MTQPDRLANAGRILSIVYNDIRRDARVSRMSDALGAEYEVEVLSVSPSRRDPVARGRYALSEIPLDHTGGFARSKYLIFWLRALLHGLFRRYDAVHCHDIYPIVPAALLARLGGVPLIYDAHELVDHVRLRPTLLGRFWDASHRWAVRRADHVITPNESRARFLVKNGYQPRRPPTSIMNIPDDSSAGRSTGRSRTELGLSTSAFVVIYQGWIAEDRFTPSLVRAFDHLPEDFHLVLIGDGPAMPQVRELLGGGLARKVHAIGYIPKDEVLDYLAVSDLGVMLYDGRALNNYYCAPNKLFDYINARIPIVANDLPEVNRLLKGRGIGVIAGGTDPGALAAAILEARDLAPECRAFDALRGEYRWEAEAEKLCRLYGERILATRPEWVAP